ncbi:hypothetical protein PR202_gb29747 [Eleusine coracana subsp. coracana]|uniref:Uncharacterized protein n=1 Tax=Eleusine coracana subsp. coracana TaxID=191504 RepID=A0AAV5G0F3_ELECO|nr:hypothetical protein PR202_gb29747 [Eleusine coracana subsp. coracana]
MQAAEEGEFVGARLDAGLRAVRFSSPPSADEFAAEVFRGVAKGWDAFSRWDPHHGGLDYLLVCIPFSKFSQSCKSYLWHVNAASGSSIEQAMLKEQGCSGETSSSSSDDTEQVYLAQASSLPVPIVSMRNHVVISI